MSESRLDGICKFKIGDFVKFGKFDMTINEEFVVSRMFRVVERCVAECPGGVQIKYMVRDYGGVGRNPNAWIHEFELEPYTEEDFLRSKENKFEKALCDLLKPKDKEAI